MGVAGVVVEKTYPEERGRRNDMKKEKKTIAEKLYEAGFPTVTRWEIENNQRRTISASGQKELPPLGALVSEVKVQFFIQKNSNDLFSVFMINAHELGKPEEVEWFLKRNTEQGAGGYIDDRTTNNFYGRTPEEAVARLYIKLYSKVEPQEEVT